MVKKKYGGHVDIDCSPGDIFGMDFDKTLVVSFKSDISTLGNTLEEMVRARDPVLTGALQESERYTPNLDPNDPEIVIVAPRDLEQLQEYGRVYAQYQEGDPLGTPTYTNSPHKMHLLVSENEGLEFTEVWADYRAHLACDACVNGTGVPI